MPRVLTGRVVAVEAGPQDDPAYDPENMPIAVLVVEVDEVVAGDIDADPVRIIVARDGPLTTIEEMNDNLPQSQTMFFTVRESRRSGLSCYFL